MEPKELFVKIVTRDDEIRRYLRQLAEIAGPREDNSFFFASNAQKRRTICVFAVEDVVSK